MRLNKAITAILLSVLVISMGNHQQLVLHWCGEALSDWAASANEVSCGMEEEPACPLHSTNEKPGCCSNTTVELSLDDFAWQSLDLDLKPVLHAVLPPVGHWIAEFAFFTPQLQWYGHDPPPPRRNLHVLWRKLLM
jgi:hypothetical protein